MSSKDSNLFLNSQIDHPARKIVDKRKLPNESLRDIYLCESFYKFTNTLIPNKFPSLDGDHPRLLIPFRDEEGEIFAYQGRAFGEETPKYITIKLKDRDKIFGLDRGRQIQTLLCGRRPT